MSLLRKYAKPKKEIETDKKTLSVRIPASLYDKWKSECEENGYSMSEGVRLLLEMDLKDVEPEPPIHTLPPAPTKKTTRKSGKKNSMLPWTINDLLPCPLCNPPKWITRTNYARHVQTHGYKNGYDMIQEHLAEVEKMVTEKG